MNYHGLTHIPVPRFLLASWKKHLCKRNIHLFDEVKSDIHYLVCDACDTMVIITSVSSLEDREGLYKIILKGTKVSSSFYKKYIYDDETEEENTLILHHDYVCGKKDGKRIFKRLGD